MRRSLPALLALVLAVSAAAVLGGCGSNTKTVSVAGAPPDTETSASSPKPGTTSSTTTTSASTVPAQTTTAGGTPTPTTRSAPEPAFTEKAASSSSSSAEGLSAATAVVAAHGYSPTNTSSYHPNQTLRVLIGTRPGSGQQAFFFVDGHYIGTDTKEPSATLSVASQSETEVTLAYPNQAKVTFQLNNGKLVPLGSIPPESARQ
jgi:hypothetical protein